MTLDDVLRALEALGQAPAEQCLRAVRAQAVCPLFPPFGTMKVHEARVLYELRARTMARSKIASRGLDELLRELARRPETEQLSMAGFMGDHELYSALIDQHGNAIGCVWVGKGRSG